MKRKMAKYVKVYLIFVITFITIMSFMSYAASTYSYYFESGNADWDKWYWDINWNINNCTNRT